MSDATRHADDVTTDALAADAAVLGGARVTELELGALRAKYRRERDRRLPPEGGGRRPAAVELGFAELDPYTARTEREPRRDRVQVLVVGAGFGGLLTAARLRAAGLDSVRLVDEAGDVGGTWYWNRYPGIHCDIEASVYMPLLEELDAVPSWRYAPGEEIRRHAVAIAERFGLYEHALFHTRTTALRWVEQDACWVVETDRGDRVEARYVVISSGTLSRPKMPAIEGAEDFEGHTFHTSRWDHGYTGGRDGGPMTGLQDKRVAVVGTGATGVQVIPHVARDAAHLVVLQRTPSTVDVRDNRPTDPQWAATLAPGWQRERMDNFLATVSGEPAVGDLVQDAWTSSAQLQRKVVSGTVDESVPAHERERVEEVVDAQKMAGLRARVDGVVHDPATAAALKPWYRYMCKRPCFSDEYLQTFNRPDVTLVDTADSGGITRMTRTGVVVGDVEYEVDCLIFATGFDVGVSGVVSGELPVHGRGGTTLLESWSQGPRTLHGFYSPGFPNLFHLGALQNANAVNFVHVLQDQAEHIADVVLRGEQAGARYVEPAVEAVDAWAATIAEQATDTTTFQVECTPGYYNGEGHPRPSMSYSPGPLAFRRLLTDWREQSVDEVMVGASRPAPGVGGAP